MIYKRGILVLIILLILVSSIFATDFDTGETDNPTSTPESLKQALDSGQTFDGDIDFSYQGEKAGSSVDLPSDSHVSSTGSDINVQSKDTIKVDEGNINNGETLITENTISVKQADSVSINNVDATGVKELNVLKNTDSFDIAHADAISIQSGESTTTLTNVDNLNYLNGNYNFNHADYIKTNDFEAFNINDFSQDAQKFTTESADSLTSDCLELTNIKDAEFIIDTTKLFTKTQNIVMLDCLNNNITFVGDDESSTMIVSKDKPYSYLISKGILTMPHEEYDEILSTLSTAAGIIR